MRFLAPLCLAILIAACGTVPSNPTPPAQGADARFQSHAAQVLEEMWQEFPEYAVRMGNYKYAGRMTVPDGSRRSHLVAFYDRQLAALARFDPAALSASNRVDLALMKNRFERGRWDQLTFKSWQWQPSRTTSGATSTTS